MLKDIDPVLTPDLLWLLAAMGHGDDLALVDANFPAEAIAAATSSGRLVRLPGLTVARVARAVLSLMPIDDFVRDPVRRMEVVDNPAAVSPIQEEVQAEIDRAAGRPLPLVGIERYAFYAAARQAFAVVQVGDRRPYGCFLLRNGVILAA
ncbi:RbsD/FucU domain-containing protein [Chelatococcus sp. SYSU_G07232]|uniref:RbsD/FucU domain-containing protein n=1 Tax=Chelatococcus albus TaxID=3047466 RepID=A0ABT7ADN4_9HYPH|nr:RbsD/FucU domain-containing protein [Chelatococcus sp. SYSU_G07232]MDJ1157490.1 RbsD/FucU domain-containing protein [Chelatococcus sp. SYSU_G07232]